MVSSLGYNPVQTTNATGSFNIESTGWVQGVAMDAPAIRNSLAGGVLATDETLPMWGGLGIYENVPGAPSPGPGVVLGGVVGRATSITEAAAKSLTGFSVFDQAHHMAQTPTSEVPVSLSSMSVHFYRFGSGARIPVKCDPALIDLQGNIITSLVMWDFVNQMLIAGTPAGADPVADPAVAIPVRVLGVRATNCMTVQYDTTTGFATWNRNGCCALILI